MFRDVAIIGSPKTIYEGGYFMVSCNVSPYRHTPNWIYFFFIKKKRGGLGLEDLWEMNEYGNNNNMT